jgi:uncharacterized membrane protein
MAANFRTDVIMKRLGLLFFAIGIIGVGTLSIIHQDFALVWQPVSTNLPFRNVYAVISGIVLLVGGLTLVWPRTAGWSAVVLAAFLSSWLILLQLPQALTNSGVKVWTPFAETVILVCGGWMLVAFSPPEILAPTLKSERWSAGRRPLQLLYGFAPPVISFAHFILAKDTAAMIPSWIPFRLEFAYLTGVAHIAAGIGIVTGIAPRLAASLEATMIGLFVVLVHIPLVAAYPSSRVLWTMLFIATACSGASWIVAASFPRTRFTQTYPYTDLEPISPKDNFTDEHIDESVPNQSRPNR